MPEGFIHRVHTAVVHKCPRLRVRKDVVLLYPRQDLRSDACSISVPGVYSCSRRMLDLCSASHCMQHLCVISQAQTRQGSLIWHLPGCEAPQHLAGQAGKCGRHGNRLIQICAHARLLQGCMLQQPLTGLVGCAWHPPCSAIVPRATSRTPCLPADCMKACTHAWRHHKTRAHRCGQIKVG